MSNGSGDELTFDLFAETSPPERETRGLDWPDPARFPMNVNRQMVREVVLGDLKSAPDPLIVTGYASLDTLIDFISGCTPEANVRVLLGFEPHPSRRESFAGRGQAFSREVQRYWLERGISLLLSAKLIQCIERLERGQVGARCLADSGRRLHAKIYVGERGATVGSSNFTSSGLERQLEANARFTAVKEPKRYQELRGIAENLWSLGRDYNAELIVLLQELLRKVPWREALARACAELLEGDWAREFLGDGYLPGEADLWPAQRQGVAQALYVLSRQGSVLVADATGSGKTRMGANLVRAVMDQIVRSGRLRKGKAIMICPPAVEEGWNWEATYAGAPLEIVSHGALSHTRSGRHALTVESLRRAQILCVDEGHNFLNFNSNRTQTLLRNMADHVLLFTATPINRSVVDLLRIADMLGADNLEPSTLQAFRKLLGVRDINRSLTEEEIGALRAEIQKFTVRRTKGMLNTLIDREPDAYLDKAGRACRFPRHEPRIYPLHETDADRTLAAEIRELAGGLYAASHFVRPIEMPEVLARQGWSQESFLSSRLHSATKIARYAIMAALRSSRLALAEHVVGTTRAVDDFELAAFSKRASTGNMLARLEHVRGHPPANRLDIELPEWLTEPAAHTAACDHDHRIYTRIYELVRKMSDSRERAKAALLLDLVGRHGLVLAFDRSPITLAEIRRYINAQAPRQKTVIATGDPGSQRAQLLRDFQWGSAARGLIGLCSDSLSEGVNLQQASCMVHLDMPSVVRIAEQRAGRVDRMDSPHAAIEAWWPQDAPEFALSSDEHFVERYEAVDSLLGSNMPLPGQMLGTHVRALSTEEVIAEYEAHSERTQWDEIHDAFDPVRRLVEDGDALIPPATYEAYRRVDAPVLSRVSVVRSAGPWAFFCLSGSGLRAPQWLLFPGPRAKPLTELGPICDGLRRRLDAGAEDLPMDESAAEQLARFVARLGEAERGLLPRKKQRALEELAIVTEHFVDIAAVRRDQEALDDYRAVLNMVRWPDPRRHPDWNEVAARWLDLIRPVWYARLKQPRNKPLLLKDIRPDLIQSEDTLGPQIREALRRIPTLPPPDERISACILGLGEARVGPEDSQ